MTVQLEERREASQVTPSSRRGQVVARPGMMGLIDNRHLIGLMVKRDFEGKYKGSLLGLLWPVINPLGHLLLYTFVFSVVLKVKFGNDPSMSNFALYLMTGLLPWACLSESLSRASTCILEVPNLVKKVVFPLEILPFSIVSSSMVNQLVGTAILLVMATVYLGTLHWTLLFLPVIMLSQFVFITGLSWLLAGLGVFVQDLRHFIALGLSVWMYTTPLVYPASAFPENLKFLAWVNPMAGILTDYRAVILQGTPPDLWHYAFYTAVGVTLWFLGFFFFTKTKHSFADVM